MATKLSLIYEGWKNLAFKDPKVEAIAKKRAEICAKCPSLVLMRKDGQVAWCERCWCPIAAKTRATKEHCPEGKWSAVNT